MTYNNIAVELLTKHRGRLEKELAETTQDKEEFLTSLLKVETDIRGIKAKIDQCTKEINSLVSPYTIIGSSVGTITGSTTTGFFTSNSCPKQ